MAKKIGLGQKRKVARNASSTDAAPAKGPARRGRKAEAPKPE